jgi:hypothetical protein
MEKKRVMAVVLSATIAKLTSQNGPRSKRPQVEVNPLLYGIS